jgi:hypothetical protein
MRAGQPTSSEPPTTRLSVAAKNAAKAVINNASAITQRTQRPAPPPPRQDREIESWLGELRGTGGDQPAAEQSPDVTRAMPEAQGKPDSESTEKLPKQGKRGRRPNDRQSDDESRHGGGVSAQELLRREGRL